LIPPEDIPGEIREQASQEPAFHAIVAISRNFVHFFLFFSGGFSAGAGERIVSLIISCFVVAITNSCYSVPLLTVVINM